MAKAAKAPTEGGGDVASLIKDIQKEYGETSVSLGGGFENAERIPTGCYALDLATGGGLPRGRCTIIYGPESSSKTNLALLAIANHQKMFPHLKCAFVDVEHSFNKAWAKKIGVDVDKLYVLKPTYAEQAVNMVEGLLSAEDCGLVVVDSLAALVSMQEMDSDAEKAVVGGASNPVGKMVRKSTLAMGEAAKSNRFPTLIYINQIRIKIGVMFGDPESMPGGFGPRFQTSMWIRVYGKNVIDAKISQNLPVRKDIKFVIKKWKVPIFAISGEFEMVTIPHKGLKVGQSDDFGTIKELLTEINEFTAAPKGGGWVILGETYKKQSDFEYRLINDFAFANKLKAALIHEFVVKANMDDEGDTLEDEE